MTGEERAVGVIWMSTLRVLRVSGGFASQAPIIKYQSYVFSSVVFPYQVSLALAIQPPHIMFEARVGMTSKSAEVYPSWRRGYSISASTAFLKDGFVLEGRLLEI